jgi:hypothetical protein
MNTLHTLDSLVATVGRGFTRDGRLALTPTAVWAAHTLDYRVPGLRDLYLAEVWRRANALHVAIESEAYPDPEEEALSRRMFTVAWQADASLRNRPGTFGPVDWRR